MMRNALDYMLMASLALAIVFSAPASAQQESSREQMIYMVLQIQELQDEVRMLRGQLEEQAHQIETLKQRQRDQYLDLDQRIGELSSQRPAFTGPQTAPATVYIPPEEDVPEVRSGTREPSSVTGLATPQTSARTVAGSPEDEKEMYNRAFQALKELRYADAAEEFQAFLQTYPQSDLADNAQYWLGESYYVTRNYEIALEAFQTLINDFPQSLKVPDSLLKVGYTHYELKQWELARAALTQVQEQYPNTTVARLAENRLRSMRVEGHF
jgi:tol-pal system protein YbgF